MLSIAEIARQCQSNESKAESIERNRMIKIPLPNAIEYQSNITVIFSIDSIAFVWFDWLSLSEVTLNGMNRRKIVIKGTFLSGISVIEKHFGFGNSVKTGIYFGISET